MSATREQRPKQRVNRHKCASNAHEFPRPLSLRRPCVTFCIRCQIGKDAR